MPTDSMSTPSAVRRVMSAIARKKNPAMSAATGSPSQ